MEKNRSGIYSIVNKGNLFRLVFIIAVYVLIFLAVNFDLLNRQYRGVLVWFFVNIILAVSLNLVTGFLGELSLGHAGFMMVGAYTGAICTKYMSETFPGMPDFALFFAAVLIGGLLAGFIGVLVGIPVLRLRGDYLAIVTLAFGEIVRSVCEVLKITNGSAGMKAVKYYSDYKHFSYGFVLMIITVIVISNLIRSRQGRAIVSLRENYIAAESVGIPVAKFKVLAFSIGAFFAGIAGVIYAHGVSSIVPGDAGYAKSIDILVIVVLGGMGSIKGSIIAAIILTVVKEVLRDAAEYQQLIYSVVLILIVLITFSSQLSGVKDRIRNRLFRRQIKEEK